MAGPITTPTPDSGRGVDASYTPINPPLDFSPVGMIEYTDKWWPEIGQYVSTPDVAAVIQSAMRAGWTTAQDPAMRKALGETPTFRLLDRLAQQAATLKKPTGSGGGARTTAQDRAAYAAAIKNESDTLGLSLNDQQIKGIASVVIAEKWSPEQLTDYLTNGLDYTKLRAGTLTGGVDEIKAMASDQLLTLSDASARDYSTRVASGEMDKQGLAALFQEQAKKDYSWAAPALDKGISMRSYLMPTRDKIAGYLEKPPESVDMMDPKWLSMMQTTDAKSGLIRAATGSEVLRNARSHPDFAKTNAAQQMTTSAAQAIRSFMGA